MSLPEVQISSKRVVPNSHGILRRERDIGRDMPEARYISFTSGEGEGTVHPGRGVGTDPEKEFRHQRQRDRGPEENYWRPEPCHRRF